MRKLLTLLAVVGLHAAIGAHASEPAAPPDVAKPAAAKFGNGFYEVFEALRGQCKIGMVERNDVDVDLPTVKKRQSRIDCIGYYYDGFPRKAYFVFADEVLDLVVIETKPEEEDALRSKLAKRFGKAKSIDGDTVFMEAGVSLRSEPPRVMFFSERLKASYGKF